MTLAEYLSQPKRTSVALARELDVSHSTVLRWAEGQVPAKRIAAVCRATGLSACDLRPDLASAFAASAQAAK